MNLVVTFTQIVVARHRMNSAETYRKQLLDIYK